MKKTISIALTVMVLAVLVACGQTPAAPSSEAPFDASQPAAAGPVAEEVQGVTVPDFTVHIGDVEITQDDMAEFPIYSVQATSVNSAGNESTVTYVGFMMKDVLAAAELTENYVWLQAVANDGYDIVVTGDVVMEDTTLLAITKDGSPFGDGPWFAPCSSETTGDYLKNLETIFVNTVEEAPEGALITSDAA